MIPKVIHYCWFGGGNKSELIQQCIESWKKFCPDYKIIEWNETNFDISCIPYVRAAYEDKKWAFVSDYARLWIVYNYGGIYLDTDVLLHHSLDDLLDYDCWLASDDVRYIATGLGFGAEKENYIIKAMMDAYEVYEYPSGTNVTRDTIILEKILNKWKKSNENQVVNNILIVGLNGYGKYAKHLYTCTWAEDEEIVKKREAEITQNKTNKLSQCLIWKVKCYFRNPQFIEYFDKIKGTKWEKIYTFCAYDLLDNGFLYYVKRRLKEIRKL